MKRALACAALVLAACSGSDPAEMARERGAVELARSWPCTAAGAIDLGRVAGGDLKTDWSAVKQPDGAYRVKAGEAQFRVTFAPRDVAPLDAAARAAWQRCR